MARRRTGGTIHAMTTADMPAESPRRLTRAHDGRVIAGVCQGAARYFDVDPVIFRIVLAVLTVFGGAGVVLYVLAWVFVPDENAAETRLERWMTRGRFDLRQVLLLAVIAVSVVVFLANTHIFGHRFGAAAVAVLAALLVTELVGRRTGHGLFQSRAARAVTYGPPPARATSTATLPLPEPVVVRAPKERAWVGWLTFGALLLAVGVMWLMATSGAAHPQPADALAVCVAIAGVGLLVATFVGRARAMIPIGLLLVIALGVASALPRDLTWSAGTRSWAPVTSDLAPSYVLGAGKADLDLTHLDPTIPATVDARIGAGRLIVIVPAGMGVYVDAKVAAGRLYMFGHEQDGTGVKSSTTIQPKPHDDYLTLHLQAGFGDLEVRSAAA